jgi:hypothetical protein
VQDAVRNRILEDEKINEIFSVIPGASVTGIREEK